jgi:hypothetical protein
VPQALHDNGNGGDNDRILGAQVQDADENEQEPHRHRSFHARKLNLQGGSDNSREEVYEENAPVSQLPVRSGAVKNCRSHQEEGPDIEVGRATPQPLFGVRR